MSAEEKLIKKVEEMIVNYIYTHSIEEIRVLHQKIDDICDRVSARKKERDEQERIKNIPSVDRSKRCMLSGNPETPDHREIQPDGMQKDYVVLCPDERAKGFVRPVRQSYIHIGRPPEGEKIEYPYRKIYLGGCGKRTTMGIALAETYARDPEFYSGTFCCTCGEHRPLNEFVWEGTTEQVGS